MPEPHSIKHLIIADDDDDDQMLLKEVIEDFSSTITITPMPDGKQLMKSLHSGARPDLVLLDLNMPYKNGAECLTEMRADKEMRDIPVVILSTSKHARDIEFCYEHGARLFFTKPCSFRELQTLIFSILSVNWKNFTGIDSKERFLQIASEGILPQTQNA